MKALRHATIREIVENNVIETQEDLAEALSQREIKVTQATVSRDIKELMLIKVPADEGRYRYAFPVENNIAFLQPRMERIFQDSVVGMDYSGNIIVIKTLPGTAQAVAAAIDNTKWPDIIGTVAGDDNILVVVKPIDAVSKVLVKLLALSH
ncbi:arginine repressor [Pelosinus sp. sgz500959]|uniref:arginine repressor n=1 Tax=Pelosinus sp. sgz500959 TaxID=3242472 RepID=UPI00366B1A64